MLHVWKNRNRLPLRLETLEDRTTPAGNIAAQVFDGVLYITGDNAANQFSVNGAGSRTASIVPLDADTTINGQAGSILLSGISKGIHIQSGEGDDLIQLNGFQARNTIVIFTEGGANTVQLNGVYAGKGAVIVTGAGNDRVSVTGSTFGSLFSLSTGGGDDFMQVSGNRFLAKALFNGGTGSNTYTPDGSNSFSRGFGTAGFTPGSAPANGGVTPPVVTPPDTTAPSVTLSVNATNPTNANPIPFSVQFSESVTGFVASDITVTNGTVSNFTSLDGSRYTFNVIPTGQGTVSASIAAGAASDAAGNASTASNTVSLVFDSIAPTVTINSQTTNDTTPTITGTVSDPTATVTVIVDKTNQTATVTGNNWSVTLGQLDPGTYSVTARAIDAAGNIGTVTAATGLVINTTPLGLALSTSPNVTNPSASTNAATVTFTATFTANVADFALADIQVAGGAAGNFVTVDAKTYKFDVTPAAAGPVTVTIPADAARDAANNANALTTASFTSDTTAPNVAVSTVPSNLANPTNLASIPFQAVFTEGVTGFAEGDIQVTNGSVAAGSFTAVNATTYTFNVIANGDGNVIVSIPAGSGTDAAGNGNTAGAASITSDRTPPSGTVDATATGVVSGTAADTAPGTVANVQISISNGTNFWDGTAFSSATEVFLNATGTTTWSYAIAATGTFTVNVRVTDNAGNVTTVGGSTIVT